MVTRRWEAPGFSMTRRRPQRLVSPLNMRARRADRGRCWTFVRQQSPARWRAEDGKGDVKHIETYDEGAERLLDRWAWQVYATPTWRHPVSRWSAQRGIHAFLPRFGDQAFAYVAYERGKLGGRIHVHMLIGGLNSFAQARGNVLWQWRRGKPIPGHGDIKWERYRRHGGAAAYVMKDAQFEPEVEEFFGPLRRLYPRKRGRRGR